MVKISIVIVSFNVEEYIKKCIDSILLQQDEAVEIIVADNNSKDGTVEFIKSKYPSIKLICNSSNAGFSAANNMGIEEASGDLLFLLNPDTELKVPGTLQEIRKYMEINPGTAILAPCLLNTDGSYQHSFWQYSPVKDTLFALFNIHAKNTLNPPSAPIPIQVASGAALVFRRTLSDEIGGLDENMFWMEDIDFCYRAWRLGKRIIFNPEVKIIHHGGKSSVKNEAVAIPNQVLSKIKFSQKNDTKLIFYAVNSLYLLYICSRFFASALLSITSEKYAAKRRAYGITFRAYFNFNFRDKKDIIT